MIYAGPGAVFTPSPEQPVLEIHDLGEPGAAYRRIELRFRVVLADFRADLPPDDLERWDHVMVQLYRDHQPQSCQRYLFGSSARHETAKADRAFNYGRVEIAMGASSYKAWKPNFPWQEGETYDVVQTIDADTDEQILELWQGGEQVLTSVGDVAYYDPALTTDQLYLELGTHDADWGLHVSPWGWTFSDVELRAWE